MVFSWVLGSRFLLAALQKAIAAPVPPDCKQPEMLELRKRCLALIMEAKAKKKEKAEECAQV